MKESSHVLNNDYEHSIVLCFIKQSKLIKLDTSTFVYNLGCLP